MKGFFKLSIVLTFVAISVVLTLPAAAQVQRDTYRIDVPFEFYFTTTEFPCLTETLHNFGVYQEHLSTFTDATGMTHYLLHQTANNNNMTTVGLTTGDTYRNSGPLTNTAYGDLELPFPVEFTFHNVIHVIGPARDTNIYLRFLSHMTFDPATGTIKADVQRQDVLCH